MPVHSYPPQDVPEDKMLSLMTPLRAPILNPSNSTCYLGSLLQSIFQSSAIEHLVLQHITDPSCGEACPWCLLKTSAIATQDHKAKHDPTAWSDFFLMLDGHLSPESMWRFGRRQHDPMEAFQTILHTAGARTLQEQTTHMPKINDIIGIIVRSVIWGIY